jgi:hypothetical protein
MLEPNPAVEPAVTAAARRRGQALGYFARRRRAQRDAAASSSVASPPAPPAAPTGAAPQPNHQPLDINSNVLVAAAVRGVSADELVLEGQRMAARREQLEQAILDIQSSGVAVATDEQLASEVYRRNPGLKQPGEQWADFVRAVKAAAGQLDTRAPGYMPTPDKEERRRRQVAEAVANGRAVPDEEPSDELNAGFNLAIGAAIDRLSQGGAPPSEQRRQAIVAELLSAGGVGR